MCMKPWCSSLRTLVFCAVNRWAIDAQNDCWFTTCTISESQPTTKAACSGPRQDSFFVILHHSVFTVSVEMHGAQLCVHTLWPGHRHQTTKRVLLRIITYEYSGFVLLTIKIWRSVLSERCNCIFCTSSSIVIICRLSVVVCDASVLRKSHGI